MCLLCVSVCLCVCVCVRVCLCVCMSLSVHKHQYLLYIYIYSVYSHLVSQISHTPDHLLLTFTAEFRLKIVFIKVNTELLISESKYNFIMNIFRQIVTFLTSLPLYRGIELFLVTRCLLRRVDDR